MSHLPVKVKDKAFVLRKKGFSIKEISVLLHISKSTASVWLNNIDLSPAALKRLAGRKILGQYKSIQIKKAKREILFRNFRNVANKEITSLGFDKRLYRLICAILFWCEGNKNTMTLVRFTNSDSTMISYFLKLLRNGFQINETKFRALVHLHEYHDEQKQLNFWSNITGIPIQQFNRSYWKPHTKKRLRTDYPGCISISYYDAQIAKKLWAYYKEAQNMF